MTQFEKIKINKIKRIEETTIEELAERMRCTLCGVLVGREHCTKTKCNKAMKAVLEKLSVEV